MKLTQNRRAEKICRKNKMEGSKLGMGVMILGLPLLLEDRCPFCMMPSRATEEEACVPPILGAPDLPGMNGDKPTQPWLTLGSPCDQTR